MNSGAEFVLSDLIQCKNHQGACEKSKHYHALKLLVRKHTSNAPYQSLTYHICAEHKYQGVGRPENHSCSLILIRLSGDSLRLSGLQGR